MNEPNILLDFSDLDNKNYQQETKPSDIIFDEKPLPPEKNPYGHLPCPTDIYDYLLPDGSKFCLFSDPYATMVYVDVYTGANHGRYWLEKRLEEHTFTERELRLIEFLSTHRVATSSQIQRVVFPGVEKRKIVTEFLQRCRKRGIICAFTWVSPIDEADGPKKPLVYGLTRVGAEAVEILFHKQVPEDFWFHPIKFTRGRGPSMTPFFFDLAANELYSQLQRIDRCISWQRRPQIRLNGGGSHHPGAVFEVIKDIGEFRIFWLEVVRPGKDWIEKTKHRFKRTQTAIESLSPYQRPVRVIIVTDGDARIPFLAKMAEKYMPNVQCRFTNDERLLQGLNKETFIAWNKETQQMTLSSIPFMQEGYEGATASEYFSEQTLNVEDEDELNYEE